MKVVTNVIGYALWRLARIKPCLRRNLVFTTNEAHLKSLKELPVPDDAMLRDVMVDQVLDKINGILELIERRQIHPV
jgi:hypothetical protein